MGKDSKKTLYIEALRAIAILFVIFNHTKQYGYVYFTQCSQGSFEYWFYMFFSVIAGISVPLFYMISGAVLMGKDETIGYVWKKRILKYLVILLLFSVILYVWKDHYSDDFSVMSFLKKTYSESVIVPYWFLYTYIAFLIGLPILRKAVINMSDRDFLYMLGIWLVFNGLIYIIQYRLSGGTIWMNELLIPAYLTNYLFFYPALGYYAAIKLNKVTDRMCIISSVLAIISIAVTMFMTDYRITLTAELNESYVSSFYETTRPVQVFFIFTIIRRLFENRKVPAYIETALLNLGSCVLGMYLTEEVFRDILYFIYDTLRINMNSFIAVWIYVLAVYIVCWSCVAAVKYIYGLLNRYLKMSNASKA